MHDLLFTLPNQKYPWKRDVRVSAVGEDFDSRLHRQGLLVTADQCSARTVSLPYGPSWRNSWPRTDGRRVVVAPNGSAGHRLAALLTIDGARGRGIMSATGTRSVVAAGYVELHLDQVIGCSAPLPSTPCSGTQRTASQLLGRDARQPSRSRLRSSAGQGPCGRAPRRSGRSRSPFMRPARDERGASVSGARIRLVGGVRSPSTGAATGAPCSPRDHRWPPAHSLLDQLHSPTLRSQGRRGRCTPPRLARCGGKERRDPSRSP